MYLKGQTGYRKLLNLRVILLIDNIKGNYETEYIAFDTIYIHDTTYSDNNNNNVLIIMITMMSITY